MIQLGEYSPQLSRTLEALDADNALLDGINALPGPEANCSQHCNEEADFVGSTAAAGRATLAAASAALAAKQTAEVLLNILDDVVKVGLQYDPSTKRVSELQRQPEQSRFTDSAKDLAAAGLDVYNGEPDAIHPGYRELDNVFLLPHIGSATRETRDAMGYRALDNLDAIFAGKEPGDRVA